jgi:uncharacterized protein
MHPFLLSLLGGLLIGLASWLLLFTLGRVAGISGIASGLMVPAAMPRGERGWRWAFVAGLVVAGGVAVSVIGQPALAATRPVGLLVVAGLLVGYGTVLGSGCTSGHGVCGLGRRSARSLAATLTFMGAGMVTVWLGKALAA